MRINLSKGINMNAAVLKVVITGLFFLLIFVFGFWLSGLGKPYNSILFNIHKLVGLAAAVFLIVLLVQRHKAVPLQPLEIGAVVLTATIFVTTIVTGGLLNVLATGGLATLGRPVRLAILLVHKIFPYLAVLSTAGTLYLVFFRR